MILGCKTEFNKFHRLIIITFLISSHLLATIPMVLTGNHVNLAWKQYLRNKYVCKPSYKIANFMKNEPKFNIETLILVSSFNFSTL